MISRTLYRRALGYACIWLLTCAQAALAASTSVPLDYPKPLVAQRADPWMLRYQDRYFFVATAPEYDRIELRSADIITEIANAIPSVIWRKHPSGPMSAHIWAPELHRIDGAWYIYFAAGEAENPWKIRMYALRNASTDPRNGEWQEMGRIATPVDTFSLDATSFSHNGKRYLVWAQYDEENVRGSSLLMAEMASPVEIREPVITLSDPTFDWERIGHKVNEGPAVLKKHDRIFITYSASATDANYAMGLLWADQSADLMDPASWQKSPEPVFFTNAEEKRFGPGHSSFTLAEDGKTDLLVYHARDYREIKGNPLMDTNRATRVRVLHWDHSGMPDFRQHSPD
ncbi:family 43 glycosylhydrolase [Microbulbifer bruguierae]|uniref:Family 43 glycosylhydrolase n=1 Tax=Microbulbifer bruguierae TaxID=3029061 RepID=A0ABY8NF07_9GAMM|nr:family 43 glycosylhydrolase [Microbulbifer bruguierae]WGL16068.1 family 43 glycosylhydrolase [Microbulbifer bruguierae]